MAMVPFSRLGYAALATELTVRRRGAGASAPTPAAARRALSSEAAPPAPEPPKSWPVRNPFQFQLGISTVKTSVADGFTQKVIEGKDEIDWKRNAVFMLFGFGYLGGFQYWLQANKFAQWFPTTHTFTAKSFAEKLKDKAGLLDAAKAIGFDVFIHLPFMYYPTFYFVKEGVAANSVNPAVLIPGAWNNFTTNFATDTSKALTCWGPAGLVIFTVPMWLRLPCRHFVSFGWTMYLSFLRG